MKFRTKIFLMSIAVIGQAFCRMSDAEIRHKFLILSSATESERARETALKKLVKEGTRSAEIALKYIDRKSQNKQDAIEAVIVGIGDDAVKPLMYILTSSDNIKAAFSARLLGKIGTSRAVIPLMLAAGSPSEIVRASAVGALGNCKDSAAIPILIKALNDSMVSVRRNSSISLGRIGNVKGAIPLISVLADSSAFVRYSASYSLASIGNGSVVDTLLVLLESKDVDQIVKFHIMETLGAMRATKAIPILTDMLDDPSYMTRGFACQALGHYKGNYKIANDLKRALRDSSGFVRMMARDALHSLRNENK